MATSQPLLKYPAALDAPVLTESPTVSDLVPLNSWTSNATSTITGRAPLPLLYTLVAYSLDTQAIAKSYTFTPEEHTAVCSVPVGRYLGIVTFVLNSRPGEYVINFVGKTTSPLGASVPKLSTPLSKSVSPTGYPQVPFCDLVVWTTSGTRVEITRLDNTRTSYTLPTAAGQDLEDGICVHYGMLGPHPRPRRSEPKISRYLRLAAPFRSVLFLI